MRLTALGAYIFAGGFTLGVREHFDVLGHLEEGPFGAETSRTNLGIPVWEELDEDAFYARAHEVVRKSKRKLDFLYANPPCAPWSVASHGRGTHWQDDPRLGCVKRVYRLLDLKPQVWAWESVRPAFTKGRELVNGFIEAAAQKGYSATVLLVNSMYHGAAQNRPRFFLVLHRVPLEFQPPKLKVVTVGEVLKALRFKGKSAYPVPEPREDLLAAVKLMKPGESLRAAWEKIPANRRKAAAHDPARGKLKGRPSFLDARLSLDGFSRAMTGGPKMYHPTERRFLNGEEVAALCGFPRSYRFLGPVYQEVARGVMPPVAEYLAGEVANSLKNKRGKPNREPRVVTVFSDRIEEETLT